MKNNDCIQNLLKVIDLLQRNSSNKFCSEEGCSRSYLGPTVSLQCYNTRPISFYTKDGSLFTFSNDTITSSFFRVEKVKDGCVVLRVLTLADGTYTSTNEFITIPTRCICAMRCFEDTSIDCL